MFLILPPKQGSSDDFLALLQSSASCPLHCGALWGSARPRCQGGGWVTAGLGGARVAGGLGNASLVLCVRPWRTPRTPRRGSSHASMVAARRCLCSPACPLPAQPLPHGRGAAALVTSSVVLGCWWVPGPPARCHRVLSLLPISGRLRGSRPSRSVVVGFAARIGPAGLWAAAERRAEGGGLGCCPALCTPVALETCLGAQHRALHRDPCLPVSVMLQQRSTSLSGERWGESRAQGQRGMLSLETQPSSRE